MNVYVGIDWSENKHDICFLNESGVMLRILQIAHTVAGFRELDRTRQTLGIGTHEVAIGLETAHNLLVDYLWDQGYPSIYILPPQAVKSAQGRFRQSGAKDDPWDARLIADILRTDRRRYRFWKPDQALTCQIRAEVRFVAQIGQELVRDGNRLRATLLRYYPAATEAFSRLEAVVALAFLQAYSTPQQAQPLSFEELQAFLRQHHHTHTRSWPKIYARLHHDDPQPSPELAAVYSPLMLAQARILEQLVQSRSECLSRLGQLYSQHPDHEICDSRSQNGSSFGSRPAGETG